MNGVRNGFQAHLNLRDKLMSLLAKVGIGSLSNARYERGYPSYQTRQERKPPNCPGIYVFWAADSPIYIGESLSLLSRVKMSHEKVPELFPFEEVAVSFYPIGDITFRTKKKRLTIESQLIEIYEPVLNNNNNFAISHWGKHTLEKMILTYFSELTFERIPSRSGKSRAAIERVYLDDGTRTDLISIDLRRASKPKARIESAIKLYKSQKMFPEAAIWALNQEKCVCRESFIARINPGIIDQINPEHSYRRGRIDYRRALMIGMPVNSFGRNVTQTRIIKDAPDITEVALLYDISVLPDRSDLSVQARKNYDDYPPKVLVKKAIEINCIDACLQDLFSRFVKENSNRPSNGVKVTINSYEFTDEEFCSVIFYETSSDWYTYCERWKEAISQSWTKTQIKLFQNALKEMLSRHAKGISPIEADGWRVFL